LTATLDHVVMKLGDERARGLSFYEWTGEVQAFPYAKVLERSLLHASSLRDLGLARGDRVALIAPTTPSSVFSLLGIWLAGGIPSCLPPVALGRLADYHGATSRMLSALSPAMILTDERTGTALSPVLSKVRPRLGTHVLDKVARANRVLEAVDAQPSDIALIQFSSGTTVDPKPIAIRHESIVQNLTGMLTRYPKPYEQHSGVSWLPLYHDMGLIGGLLMGLYSRADLALIRPEHFVAKPLLWLDVLSRTGATSSGGPNFAYGLCVTRISQRELEHLDLSHWKVALVGAENVQASTLSRFAKHLAPCGFDARALTPAYGLAEGTLGVSFATPGQPLRTCTLSPRLEVGSRVEESPEGRTYVSVGTPIPGTKIEIRDTDQNVLPEHHLGSIWISSTSLMDGYWARPEETQKVLRGSWLDTGDLGFVIDGELYIYGRAKDLIVINGKNHDPAFIEESLEGVADLTASRVAAFSYADEARHTEVLCVLAEHVSVPQRPLDVVATSARETIIRRTGLIPDCLYLVAPGVLPRTTSGKVQRSRARMEWQQGKLVSVARSLRSAQHAPDASL
jgi:acyl-CoA synthetase (AMP-forming)/AMP-acid ligase II